MNKKASKIQTFYASQTTLFPLKFVGEAFVSLSYDSIISSHVIAKYLLDIFHFCNCMQKDSKYNLFHINDVFYTYIDIYRYLTIDLNYIFFHQIYIYICMMYALLMYLVYLFLQSCWTCLDLNLLFYLEHTLYYISH